MCVCVCVCVFVCFFVCFFVLFYVDDKMSVCYNVSIDTFRSKVQVYRKINRRLGAALVFRRIIYVW